MGELPSTFHDFVGALQATNGRNVFVEVIRNDDHHVVAELSGRLGAVAPGEDCSNNRRGVGWVPVGDQPHVGRERASGLDPARFRGAEVCDVVFRGMFDDLIYVIALGQKVR